MAIIARDANVAPGGVRDRMPACLAPDVYDDWLGNHLGPEELMHLLDRASSAVAHDLSHHGVSKDVDSVRDNGAQLLEPLR